MRIEIDDDFDLHKIDISGQCFRVNDFAEGLYRFVHRDNVLYIRRICEGTYDVDCDLNTWTDVWHPYFDLDRNYRRIRESIPKEDVFMREAAEDGAGIRILRQDPFEMIISFIISQRKSIPAIRTSIELICRRYGTPVTTPYEKLYLFPAPSILAQATVDELRECKLGYRVPYILDAARRVADRVLVPDDLYALPDEALFETLLTVKGIGRKVANCICLFAYSRTAMVPVDTWIAQIIEHEYNGRNAFLDYGNVGGIMQQYAFYHYRPSRD